MNPLFQLHRTRAGFHFNLTAKNGQIILTSEKYEQREGAINGIESVKTNSADEKSFKRKRSSDKKHYFIMRAKNNKIIGTSEMYETKDGMNNGIESVMENAPKATLKETGMPQDIADKKTEEE